METAFILLTAVVLLEAVALMAIAMTLDSSESVPMYRIVDTPAGRSLMKTGYICGTVYTVIHGYVLWV